MAEPVVIGHRTGTMLVPGVSRNGRLYSKENIGKAVSRMRDRIADPDGLPIVMRTHHDAGDDSALVVGRVVDVSVTEDGAAKYKAALFDTGPGRDIVTLTSGKQPAIRSTSIWGYWLGPVRRVQHQGETVETADDIEIDKIDFTATPGVTGAVIDVVNPATSETLARTAISESWDSTVESEAGEAKKPYGNVQYADPGYLSDKVKRYPLDTEKRIRAAWSYINQADNAKQYSPKQLARIKGRIKAALKRIGAKVSDETTTRLGEIREYYPEGPGGPTGFCVDIYAGPLSMTLRGCGIEPADLRAVTMAAMSAACDAMQAMDPDQDADIDVPGETTTEDDPNDDDMGETTTETATPPGAVVTETAPTVGDSNDNTETEEVPAVSEAQTAETTAAPTGRTLSDADISALGTVISTVFVQALKENLPAPAAPVTQAAAPVTSETASPTTETQKVESGDALKETVDTAVKAAVAEALAAERAATDARVKTALDEQRAALREELLKNGLPARAGFRVHENDVAPSVADAWANRADVMLGDHARTPVPVPGTGTAAPVAQPEPAPVA